MRGGIQNAVEHDQTGLLVQLVFLLASLFDLDNRHEVVGGDPVRIDVMPYIHIVSLLLIDFADFIIQHRRRIFKGLFSKISSPQGEFIHIMVLTTEDSVQEVRYG